MSTGAGRDCFETRAQDYAAYLETPEGRLRSDLAFAGLHEFLRFAEHPRPLRALDIGSGCGTMAVRLARLGVHVTVLDSSSTMLDLAGRAAREAGVAGSIELKHGDAADVVDLFIPQSFEVIVCHNVLEYVDDPSAVLHGAAQLMAGPSDILSVVVRNQAGEVLKAALQSGALDEAEHLLTAERARESLFGQTLRLFTPASVQAMLKESTLRVVTERGIRVISDYLPLTVSRSEQYERIVELERKLGGRPEFAAVARYTQYLIRHTGGT